MPRQDISEERKAQILDAAAIVFSQQGFANARMDDIVNESGLSKGTLYWYFKSKDEIIIALMHRFFRQDIEELSATIALEQPIRHVLLNHVTGFITTYSDMQSLIPLMYEYYASATRDEDKRMFFQTYFHQYQQILRDLIQTGIDNGEFKAVDADSVVLTIISLVEGLLLLNTIQVDMPTLSHQITQSITLLLDGIAANSP